MTAATVPVVVTERGGQPRAKFRTDIQGLRAVAVVLVLLYHAGVPFVPGGYVGVDVFFVISGFLITGLIVREVQQTGRLNLRRFYARRAKRLLPATAVVFVAVAAVTLLVLPVTRWASIAGDLVASALYLVNWRLADRAIDYLAADAAASPLQHFWSLAVEEQFYVVWPLLIVVLAWWLGRRGRGISTAGLFMGLLVIIVPSLLWSAHLTSVDPGPAYLVTTTRLWELGIGALLAVGSAQVDRLPRAVRAVSGWAGLAAIVVAGTTFDASTAFPGVAALLPTLGAAGVLVAGAGDGSARMRVLEPPVMQDIGALSYSLYLWHWPVLVAAIALWGDENGDLWLPTALVAVGFSAVPAWFTYRVVEKPLHQSRVLGARPWRAGVVGVLCVAVGLGAALVVHRAVPAAAEPVVTGSAAGAGALGEDPTSSPAGFAVDVVGAFTPQPTDAGADNADVYADGCHQGQEDAGVLSCTYGDPDGPVALALVGDSHAAHWQPALRVIAEANGWRLDTYTKSSCFFGDVDVWLNRFQGTYPSCREWGDNVVESLTVDPPDLVLVSSSGGYAVSLGGERMDRPQADGVLAEALTIRMQQVSDSGSAVALIVDTPWMGMDIPECVSENLEALTLCATPRDEAIDRSARAFHEDALVGRETVGIDLVDYICPQSECPAVIGGVLVFRDEHHLTGTYARSLAPVLEARVEDLLGVN